MEYNYLRKEKKKEKREKKKVNKNRKVKNKIKRIWIIGGKYYGKKW